MPGLGYDTDITCFLVQWMCQSPPQGCLKISVPACRLRKVSGYGLFRLGTRLRVRHSPLLGCPGYDGVDSGNLNVWMQTEGHLVFGYQGLSGFRVLWAQGVVLTSPGLSPGMMELTVAISMSGCRLRNVSGLRVLWAWCFRVHCKHSVWHSPRPGHPWV